MMACGFASLAVAFSTAFADPQPGATTAATGPGAGGEAGLQTVEVTATRVERSGFQAPTPVTVIGSADLERADVANFADEVEKLPELHQTQTPGTSTVNTTNAGSNFLDLRGLGTVRTLVLVNGRRFVPESPEGRVDLNDIPNALIDRLEVVTGGASADWGSDAVAGVVNVITNDKLEGFKGTVQGGDSAHGGGQDRFATLAAGTAYMGGRGHVVISAEFDNNSGVTGPGGRSWFTQNWLQIGNPAATAANGLPQILVVPNVTASNATAGGLINSGPLKGTEFLPGGLTAQFRYGTSVGSSYMTNGAGTYAWGYDSLSVPVKRAVVFATTSFDVTESTTAFAELSYAHSRSEFWLPFFTGTDFATTIHADNAFLPASVSAQLASLTLASFTMGRIGNDIPYNYTIDGNDVYRIAAGFRGTAFGSWPWSVYAQYGTTDSIADIRDVRVNSLYLQAVDAVRNPATGQIQCRSTLTNPNNGCIPINLFGLGSPDLAAEPYFTQERDLTRKLEETAVGAEIKGEPFALWAGPVSLATGAEFRLDSVRQTVSANAVSGILNLANSKPYSGSQNVKEAFLETVVPLVSPLPLVRALEFNGAVRATDYSLSGYATTWKLGLNWEPTEAVRFRVARSHDIRAPNLSELLTAQSLSFATIFDPVTNQQVTNVPAPTVGNAKLEPETGDTTTLGVVLTPPSIPGLRFSVDWYDIRLSNAIATVGAQNIVTFCFKGASQFCNAITRDANGQLTQVLNTQFNIASAKTRGIDFDLRYSLLLSRLAERLGGSLSWQLLATYVDRFSYYNGTTVVDLSASVQPDSSFNGGPRVRGLASMAYDNGPFGAYLEARYVGHGVLVPTVTYSDNSVPSWVMFNLGTSYSLPRLGALSTQLFLMVQNVADRAPPPAPTTYFPTTPGPYDVIGRYYTAGVRLRF